MCEKLSDVTKTEIRISLYLEIEKKKDNLFLFQYSEFHVILRQSSAKNSLKNIQNRCNMR